MPPSELLAACRRPSSIGSSVKKPSSYRAPDPMAGVVDRLLAQLPGLQELSAPARTAPRPVYGSAMVATPLTTVATPLREPTITAREWIGVWGRVLLGLSLGVMMAGWPYTSTCGLPLLGYLSAILFVILSGLWAAAASWKHRVALAHVVALTVLLYGITLTVAELLPRTGYASKHASWSCQDLVTAPSLVLSQKS